MKYIIYTSIFGLSIIYIFTNSNQVEITQFVVTTLITIIFLLLKERFFDNIYFTTLFYIIVSIIVFLLPFQILLLSLIIFDSSYNKYKYLSIIFSLLPAYFIISETNFMLLSIYIMGGLLGHVLGDKLLQTNHYLNILDDERRLRYELESVKQQLINNNKDIERLTEIKERNRIARDIHDNIGHDITGVLIQLQAANRIFTKDATKANNIVGVCIDKLSNSLEMIRNTVYNIKPVKEINENMFYEIIDRFIFCPIDFKIDGNLNNISSSILDVLILNLKEALTNATKYSGATKINIDITINKNYVRFFYKDNGNGCNKIKEGLGISGMKERIKNVGGTINFLSDNGFSIVCVIPLKNTNIFRE